MSFFKNANILILGRNSKKFLLKNRSIINGTIFEYSILFIAFFLVTLFYTDGVLLNGTHQLFIEGNGDGTAGFLWLNYADNDWNPAPGSTDLVNYPVGESIVGPTIISQSAIFLPLWFFTKIFGSMMALNIVTFLGFYTCAIAMYWLMKRLTNSIPVAYFSGFAAAFVPYNIMKSSSHLTYIFCVVFVLIFLAFIELWRRPSICKSLLLAVAMALAFYTDGYFILLSVVFVICLFLGSLIYDVIRKTNIHAIKQKLKYIAMSVAVFAVLISPIVFTQLSQGGQIKTQLSRLRGNISFDLDYYSARPIDFILPSVHNPFLMGSSDFVNMQNIKNTHSNASENTLYIGFVIISLTVVGFVFVVLSRLKDASLDSLSKEQKSIFLQVATISAITIPVLLVCMLPPTFQILGIDFYGPSYIFIKFNISLWRVMSRFFIPFHVMIVIFAAFSLHAILSTVNINRKNFARILLVIACTVLLALEYGTMTNRPPYDFDNSPVAYKWLRDQKDIDVIAEMPFLDRPFETNYDFITAQMIHGKKLINTHTANREIGGKNALGDEDEGEAVDYALLRGVQAIITHNSACIDRSWGSLIYKDDNPVSTKETVNYGSPICIYKVIKNSNVDDMFVSLKQGTFADAPYILNTPNGRAYFNQMYSSRGEIEIKNNTGNAVSGMAVFTANIGSTPGSKKYVGSWSISQNDVNLATGGVDVDSASVIINSAYPVIITISDGSGSPPPFFGVSLSDARVKPL